MFQLHEIPDFIRQNLPHMVDLPQEADRASYRKKLNAAIEWCNREYGAMAFTVPLRKANVVSEWHLEEDARWDMLGESFRFRDQKDAAVFRVFWG
jgi:hypothetical protein